MFVFIYYYTYLLYCFISMLNMLLIIDLKIKRKYVCYFVVTIHTFHHFDYVNTLY